MSQQQELFPTQDAAKMLRLSVSKVKTFESCLKKFNFCYNLKLPRKSFSFHEFGKFLHLIFELYYTEKKNLSVLPDNKIMNFAFGKAMETYKVKLSKEDIEEAKNIVRDFLTKISLEPETFKVLALEEGFNLSLSENVNLIGFIDRVDVDCDGILHLIDLKTSKSDKYLKDDFFQLLTYAYVKMMADPALEKVRCSYIMLRHNSNRITKTFEKAEVLKIAQGYKLVAEQIAAEQNFAPTTGPLCKYCDFLDSCDEGLEYIKKNSWNTKHGETKW